MVKFSVSLAIIMLSLLYMASNQESPCPIAQYYQFLTKQNLTPEPIIPNPYQNPSQQYLKKVQENLSNKQRVCALKYDDQRTRKKYTLANFETRESAQQAGWIVTHQGVCGKCSSTQDLYVYLTMDLTRPVRACGVKNFFSINHLRKCIKNLGFTDACTEVWLWNTLYTKKQCKQKCIWALVTKQPFVINGHLNKCLQCDEDISGPIFKYESGRTRRNSGIHSQIDRPSDEIYNVTHCYY